MTFLVTGATGSIGRAVVERLAGRHRLRLLTRAGAFPDAHARLAHTLGARAKAALRSGMIEVYDADLAQPGLGLSADRRQRVSSGLDGILHLAARTDFRDESVEAYRPTNVAPVGCLAAMASAAQCPFHFVSTAYVAGRHEGAFYERDHDVGQTHNNGYELSKFEAEALVRRLADEAGFPLAIYRPGVVLPDTPVAGAATGPGPLVHLQLLARVEGRSTDREHVIRYVGDPEGRLNLVPLAFVTSVIERGVVENATGCFHVTAARSFSMQEIGVAMNRCLTGVRIEVVDGLHEPDRFEALLDRRCRFYRPYTRLRSDFVRTRLEERFAGNDGADPDWLAGVFRRHLDVWRSEQRPEFTTEAAGAIRYFTEFLPERRGVNLVPGLRSLDASFTIHVPGAGRWRLTIDRGRLMQVEPASGPGAFDYEIDAAAFLDVAAGRVRPSALFFELRVAIRGDVYRAVATATALEEFFQLFPYRVEEIRS